jgi:hypothetical protein
MCEFCLDPNSSSSSRGGNRDAFHSDFAGFFSADAIEAAVRQAAANVAASSSSSKKGRKGDNDDEQGNTDDDADSDGT